MMCYKCSDWIRTFPELTTRPLLVEALERSHRLRRRVFHIVNVAGILARIGDPNVAAEMIQLYYEVRVKGFLAEVHDVIERQDYRVNGELVGFMKNVFTNQRQSIHPSPKHRYGMHGYDIIRTPQEKEERMRTYRASKAVAG